MPTDRVEWKLPLTCQHSGNNENIPDGHAHIYDADDETVLILDNALNAEVASLNSLVVALNSHADPVTENERMREALTSIIGVCEGPDYDLLKEQRLVEEMAREALTGDEKKGVSDAPLPD